MSSRQERSDGRDAAHKLLPFGCKFFVCSYVLAGLRLGFQRHFVGPTTVDMVVGQALFTCQIQDKLLHNVSRAAPTRTMTACQGRHSLVLQLSESILHMPQAASFRIYYEYWHTTLSRAPRSPQLVELGMCHSNPTTLMGPIGIYATLKGSGLLSYKAMGRSLTGLSLGKCLTRARVDESPGFDACVGGWPRAAGQGL